VATAFLVTIPARAIRRPGRMMTTMTLTDQTLRAAVARLSVVERRIVRDHLAGKRSAAALQILQRIKSALKASARRRRERRRV
jgi:hypothetical protein